MKIIKVLLITCIVFCVCYIYLSNCFAENKVSANSMYYQDNNQASVQTYAVDLLFDINPNTNISTKVVVDAITGASLKQQTNNIRQQTNNSDDDDKNDDKDEDKEDKDKEDDEDDDVVDAITGATRKGGGGDDRDVVKYRKEGSLGITHKINETMGSFLITQSKENNYSSLSYNLLATREFNNRNTALSFGYSIFNNRVIPVNMGWEDKSISKIYDVSLTEVLTPKSQIRFNISYGLDSGYLANPSHEIKIGTSSYQEQHPRERDKVAFASFYNLGIQRKNLLSSLQLDYRYYIDTWKIKSHTYGIRYTHYLSEPCWVFLRYRYYNQDKAYFFKNFYDTKETFMSSDLKLVPLTSSLYGIGMNYSFIPTLILDTPINLEIVYERYSQEADIDYTPYTNKKDLKSDMLYFRTNYKFTNYKF